MAAYSALACFRQTLKQLLDSDQLPPHSTKSQIESLHENVCSLQSSLDKIPFIPKKWRKKMSELQTSIRDAIYAAQDEVEYWIEGHSSDKSDDKTFMKIADEINLVKKEAEEMAEAIRNDPQAHNLFSENYQPSFNFSGKDKIVGQEEEFKAVMEWLQADDKQRLVIPITGLPGIGKTTLARSIYDNKHARTQFKIRAWVTVSQERDFQEIFSKILNSLESNNYQAGHYASQGDEQTLFNRLHQELFNLKYLMVIDDVWDTKVWDRVIQALPDKKNGSRVFLTTRIPAVAAYINRSGFVHRMQPLCLEDSWILLCCKVFGGGDEYCPHHLRDTGRSIAEKCKGLPQSLILVGGLLFQERVKVDYWKMIEEDTADAATKGEDSYLEILSLSYNYLPYKLKGCFLYMGAFPEGSGIRSSKLIKLWVAEGFSTLSPDSSVELVARRFLEDLADRNLISILEKSSDGGIKVCGMIDSIRELVECESRVEKFFHSRKKQRQLLEEDVKNQRRVSVHKNLLMSHKQVYESTRSIKFARSLLYVGTHHHHPLPFCLTFDLLRVLDAFTVYFIHFPHQFLQLFHLRYLSLTYNDDIPPKISQLQKLQVLMVRRQPKLIFVGVSFLPDEIWKMPELRHLWFTETDFPALPPSPPHNIALLFNLQTLTNVDAAFFTDEILDNMPNLKKLAMWIEAPDKIGFNVARLSKLERFKFVVLNPVPGKGIEVAAESFFPKTLRRLTLSGCGLPWEYMKYVAENLKGLEVVKLKELAFYGGEWCPDYQLKELKFLLIEYLNFQNWEASNRHFPKLQRLILRHCYELEKVPEDIKYVGPLELVELVDCSPQAVESVEDDIRAEDDSQNFQVNVFSSWE